MSNVDIVYNFYEQLPGIFLPNAFIVRRDHEGYLAHIQQRATAATIGAFHLPLTPERARSFRLIDELQPAVIAKHFQPKARKTPDLEVLWADRELRKSIGKYIDRRLDELLQLAVRQHYPLSWDAERRALVKDFVLEPVAAPLQAELHFRRVPEGTVHYRLWLREGERRWRVSEREVQALVNHPAWIVADYRLYRIDTINGYLIKPFRERDEVVIPAASVKAYFREFIVRIVSRVEVEAEGFAVTQHHTLEACTLEPVRHLFEDRWILALQMHYPQAVFGWNESRQQRTTLEIDDQDIHILQVKRQPAAEGEYLARLPALGLAPVDGGSYFEPSAPDYPADDPLALFGWLAQHRPALLAAGFVVAPVRHDEQELYLHLPRLELEVASGNDWFDLHGRVHVGEYDFPFLALVRHIREGNRFYALPNGQYFVIPQEWMARYRDVAGIGRSAGDALRLKKSQYTLLAGLVEAADELPPAQDVGHRYFPSTLLRATLRPYQLAGFRWLVHLYHQQLGACLADDMGLGKTLQTIALLLYAKEHKEIPDTNGAAQVAPAAGAAPQLSLFGPAADADFLRPLQALVVLPASLLYNWENELRQFAPSLSVYQHFGPKRHRDPRLLARFDVALTTYQTALRDAELLGKIDFEYIVLDESQQIKNRDSKVFRALSNLPARHRLSLSGTPIENSLSDLWSQMQFTNPDLLGSYAYFQKQFLNPIERQQDDAQKHKLRQLVQPYVLRRTKEEVAPDLPPLSTQVYFTEMSPEQKKMYEREKSAARNYLLDNFQPQDPKYRILVVQTLTKLRQLVNHPQLVDAGYDKESGKFEDVLAQWEVIRKSGHKVLFFSSFVQYLELYRQVLEQAGHPYAWLTGDLAASRRKQEVEKFQTQPDVQAFFISIKAGGVGLNLTAADYVFILDPWWNPTTEQQAIARAHRIGQDKSVFALKFITRDSIEEKILKLQERKLQLAEDIIGRFEKMAFDQDELAFLLA